MSFEMPLKRSHMHPMPNFTVFSIDASNPMVDIRVCTDNRLHGEAMEHLLKLGPPVLLGLHKSQI